MSRLPLAVIGGGHLGTIHAKLLQQVQDAELVAIVEPNEQRATELADLFDCEIQTDVHQFIAQSNVAGVVLAAPTSLHHEVGLPLLQRGVHALIEKPLAPTLAECQSLTSAARQSRAILQVGHVERFNPAWRAMCNRVGEPRYIEAKREGLLTFRSMDAGVVLDLMIHDIDLILSLVRSPVISVQALGFHWTGQTEDVAQARLTFANGCIANLSASRVACGPQRQMRITGRDWYSEVDFADRSCHIVHAPHEEDWQTRSYTQDERQSLMERLFTDVMRRDDIHVPEANPILDELHNFVSAIKSGSQPIVSGNDGLSAVDIANQVVARINQRTGIHTTYRQAG